MYLFLNPDERCSVTVMDCQKERLTIVCLDKDKLSHDDLLGVLRFKIGDELQVRAVGIMQLCMLCSGCARFPVTERR